MNKKRSLSRSPGVQGLERPAAGRLEFVARIPARRLAGAGDMGSQQEEQAHVLQRAGQVPFRTHLVRGLMVVHGLPLLPALPPPARRAADEVQATAEIGGGNSQ